MQSMITRATREMERIMEVCNIRITSLVSKNNSQSVLKVVEKIIAGEDTVEELACCIHGRILNAKGKLVRLSLDGHIEDHHRFSLSLVYEQLCIRKSRKKALIAIARKLLTVVWHVLTEKEPFNHQFLPVYDPNRMEMKMKYHRREIEKLEQLGYSIT